ncbi:MAG TPA: GTP cyclohydrolase II [Thermoplasmata archaeon]|nr:GTP cyclohydrolase II [Thermoplasmata archaeon]
MATSDAPDESGIPPATIEELIRASDAHDCSEGSGVCVKIAAIADLPTRFGRFQVVAFSSPSDRKEHAALIRGNIVGREGVPVRLHSECLTGDTLGSLRCDCRDQLEVALKEIAKGETGIILYLRQEGRGIGFANKIRAYQLQERGLDTVQANLALGFRPDERDYEVAAHMLESLNVRSIQLMSNNPDKINDLRYHGVRVDGRIPIVTPPNAFNRRYLETKRLKFGQLLEQPPLEEVPEQVDSAGPNLSESDPA